MVGKKFGRWIVIEIAYKINGYLYLKCECTCGSIRNVIIYSLLNGRSRSCGCWKKEERKNRKTHRMSGTRFFRIWCEARSRCSKDYDDGYKDYGGRGIKVCERWLKFENFKDDMYQSYLKHVKEFGEKNTSIDRKNNDGNYELSNCRWATWKEQANNKRNNYLITYNDQTKNITQWANILNIPKNTLHNRIVRKWSIERAMTKKPSYNRQNIKNKLE